MPQPPIDPLAGPKFALSGRVVTMDPASTVIGRGVIYVEAGRIVAVSPRGAAAPAGFEQAPRVAVGGTIYPGLIELHNHLSYNILRLWDVPRPYTNRDQWSGIAEYRKGISGPMKVIGMSPEVIPALARFVECKCLLGGVTTSQGIALFSNTGVRRFYRGIVRNVEQTDELDLPEAATRIADVDARDVHRFLVQLRRQSCFLLHLSEGIDDTARKHFRALRAEDGSWAITDALAGIHCAALRAEDFAVMAELGGAMIWSPLSNLLLYGKTADVKAAWDAGVRIGLGSDWSPSGSKNLLGELKVARLVSRAAGGFLSDRDLVAMATRTAAPILKWQNALGSIEPGKRADFLVIDNVQGDPYAHLIEARETAISLVMVNGVARYGVPSLMGKLGGGAGESIRVGGRKRRLFLDQETADPDVRPLGLTRAKAILTDALKHLPERAAELERAEAAPRAPVALEEQPVQWMLALDELAPTGLDLRPRLPLPGTDRPTGPARAAAAPTVPLSQILEPLDLDPLTVADDPDFLARLAAARNLPETIKAGLKSLY
jgi:cytosine/adenosine deaminase-related metal-dependent hydrolase